jgi:hypothetical protein
MSKQDLIEYTLDNFGRYQSLELHLGANFYPPLPAQVKKVFLDAFSQYWAYLIDIDGLVKELGRVYRGGLDQYGFYNFLNEEDLDND